MTVGTTTRSAMLNMRIDPKLKYLSELAAREEEVTLSLFVTHAIELALQTKAQRDSEDDETETVRSPFEPIPSKLLFNEGFWDEAEADRFFKLAAFRHDLLTDAEKKLWELFQLCEPDGGKGIKAFRAFWNHPMIDTTHLAAAASEGDE
jgi:hypothetical protein